MLEHAASASMKSFRNGSWNLGALLPATPRTTQDQAGSNEAADFEVRACHSKKQVFKRLYKEVPWNVRL